MGTRLLAATGLVGALLPLATAQADVLTQAIDVSYSRGTAHGPDFNFFTPFNNNLGTLTGAILQFTGTVVPELSVTVDALNAPIPTSITFVPTLSLGTALLLAGTVNYRPQDVANSENFPAETAPFTAVGNPFPSPGAPPGYFDQNYQASGTPEPANITTVVPASELAAFANFSDGPFAPGPPSILLVNSVLPDSPFYYGGDGILTTGQIQLSFTYTPNATSVPEPAFLSLGLLGAGAAWLAFARRQPRTLA